MPLPEILTYYDSPSPDGHTVSIGARFNQSDTQFIVDLQHDWGLEKPSMALRNAIKLLRIMMSDAKEKGDNFNLSPETIARMELDNAVKELERINQIKARVYKAYHLAMETSNVEIRERVLSRAGVVANNEGIEWPPTGMSLEYRDPDAINLKDSILKLMDREETDRVPSRLVMRTFNMRKDDLETKLEVIKEFGLLDTEIVRNNNGTETLWIISPTMKIAAED
jgi:hypothetical protein